MEHGDERLKDKFDVFFAEAFTSFNFEVMFFQMTGELEFLIHFEFAFKLRIEVLLFFEDLLRITQLFTELVEFALQILPFLIEDAHLFLRLILSCRIMFFAHLTDQCISLLYVLLQL